MKKYAPYYTDTKHRFDRSSGRFVSDAPGTLWSGGIYRTKLKPEDLPPHYVKLWCGVHNKYLATEGVADLVYEPNLHVNHLLKDDFLYVSYNWPIRKVENSLIKFDGYDVVLWGWNIVDFVKALDRAGSYDTGEIKRQLEEKRLWFKEHFQEEYSRTMGTDRPFFEQK